MFTWPQINDQRQRSLATAGVQTTSTSEAIYVLTAASPWPGAATLRFPNPVTEHDQACRPPPAVPASPCRIFTSLRGRPSSPYQAQISPFGAASPLSATGGVVRYPPRFLPTRLWDARVPLRDQCAGGPMSLRKSRERRRAVGRMPCPVWRGGRHVPTTAGSWQHAGPRSLIRAGHGRRRRRRRPRCAWPRGRLNRGRCCRRRYCIHGTRRRAGRPS